MTLGASVRVLTWILKTGVSELAACSLEPVAD